jgi:hypothetical protein
MVASNEALPKKGAHHGYEPDDGGSVATGRTKNQGATEGARNLNQRATEGARNFLLS